MDCKITSREGGGGVPAWEEWGQSGWYCKARNKTEGAPRNLNSRTSLRNLSWSLYLSRSLSVGRQQRHSNQSDTSRRVPKILFLREWEKRKIGLVIRNERGYRSKREWSWSIFILYSFSRWWFLLPWTQNRASNTIGWSRIVTKTGQHSMQSISHMIATHPTVDVGITLL